MQQAQQLFDDAVDRVVKISAEGRLFSNNGDFSGAKELSEEASSLRWFPLPSIAATHLGVTQDTVSHLGSRSIARRNYSMLSTDEAAQRIPHIAKIRAASIFQSGRPRG